MEGLSSRLPRVDGKRFVVTGGAGFIGSHIVEALLKQGGQVIIVDNLVSGKAENVFSMIKADLHNPNICIFGVEELQPSHNIFDGVDVLFHNAASKCTVCHDNPRKDLMVNAWGSFNVFSLAAEAGVKTIIHASTGSVYGEGGSIGSLFVPESYYGVSKLAAEHYLRLLSREYGFDYTILRYHHVYGPRQDDSDIGGVIPIFIRRALENKPLEVYGDGKQRRWFCHVDDVVWANFHMANFPFNDAVDVRGPDWFTINRLAELVIEKTGSKSEIVHSGPRAGDIRFFEFGGCVQEAVGSVLLEEGLDDTINWYKERRTSGRP